MIIAFWDKLRSAPVVVRDFAGLDAGLNDGSGVFSTAPDAMFGERHGFGMAHAFGHVDRDGVEDLDMVGMSSTTAHFGLGGHEEAEKVVVNWPDGRTSEVMVEGVDRCLRVRPPAK